MRDWSPEQMDKALLMSSIAFRQGASNAVKNTTSWAVQDVGLNIKLHHPFCIAGCPGQPTPGVSIWKYELEQEAWLRSAAVAATCPNRHGPSPDMCMLCRTVGCSVAKVADHGMSGQGQGHAVSSIIGHLQCGRFVCHCPDVCCLGCQLGEVWSLIRSRETWSDNFFCSWGMSIFLQRRLVTYTLWPTSSTNELPAEGLYDYLVPVVVLASILFQVKWKMGCWC